MKRVFLRLLNFLASTFGKANGQVSIIEMKVPLIMDAKSLHIITISPRFFLAFYLIQPTRTIKVVNHYNLYRQHFYYRLSLAGTKKLMDQCLWITLQFPGKWIVFNLSEYINKLWNTYVVFFMHRHKKIFGLA